ncbi:MAG: hypothetical protein WC390_07260 [Sulfurimonas sp.]|jgi:hypothetical protein
MLYKNLTDTNPYPYLIGQLTKLECTTLPVIPVINDQTLCPIECCYIEPVFAIAAGEDYQNDKSGFLFQKLIVADTITIVLENPTNLDKTITDNTYGTFYSTFTVKPLYVGFVLDFQKCLATLGAGLYRLKVTKVILGVTTIWYSQYFKLMQYSERAANGTVRMEWYQTGNILSNEFNYEDLLTGGWYQSIRFKGNLSKKMPKLITDNYLDENYKKLQIQDKIVNSYEIETTFLPMSISDKLIYDGLLANTIKVSNFNMYAEEFVIQRELICEEIIEKKSYIKNKNSIFLLKFDERYENNIKTNF